MRTVRESPQSALREVATIGLGNVAFVFVQDVAQWVWYGVGLPDLDDIKGPFRDEAVELLERLIKYQVVSAERKRELQALLKQECLGPGLDTRGFQKGYRKVLPQLQSMHAQAMMGRVSFHIGSRQPSR